MSRKSLLRQKLIVESLISANLKEVEFMKTYKRPDWKLMDSYYVAGRALAAEHMEILKQLQWR